MSLSLKTRFEIFKRDSFTCRYCGKKSPETILEVDHVEPISNGGGNDEMNLVTSCFDCNRGKGARNLSEIITGEDPHDKAIELAERERQIQEYNKIKIDIAKRIDSEINWIMENLYIPQQFWVRSIKSMLKEYSATDVYDALEISLTKFNSGDSDAPKYAFGILRNWRQDGKI